MVATSFHFSTGDPARRDPAAALRELNERKIVLPMAPLADRLVRAEIEQRSLAGLGLMSALLCGLSHYGTREAAAQGNGEEVFVGVTLAGGTLTRWRGREVMLQDGDGVLLSRRDAGFSLVHPEPVRFLGLRAPRRAIAPLVADLDDAMMRPISRHAEALRLLTHYVASLGQDETLARPELEGLFVTHVYDLVALAIGATRDAQMIAAGRGVRAARLRAIQRDIAANLGDCALSAAALAARHRVTPRYVHKLFESAGMTVSEFVLAQRLARAHRLLTDRRFADRTISAIAFDVGFGDLSYFNRCFRRRYEATPSEVRRGGG